MKRMIAIAVLFLPALFAAVNALAQEQNPKGQHDSILLVAAPHMMDLNFARTVVLVMFPTDTGPSGVILNRPTRMMLRDIWPERDDRQGRTDLLCVGGPVQPDGLLFLFRMQPPPQRAWWAVDDIYFSGDGDLLNTLLQQPGPDPDQRFFAGFAGWAPGQLEREIERGDWHVLKVDAEVVYDTELDTLWQRMHQRATMLRAGPEVFPRAVAISHHHAAASSRISAGLALSPGTGNR
jgi:putative transcriptional regulator